MRSNHSTTNAVCIFVIVSILQLHSSNMINAEHIQQKIRRQEAPCRGVNLGSWLVLEHWMTKDSKIWDGVPSEISSLGEYKTMEYLGHKEGSKRVNAHRKAWITEKDIEEMANSKMINTVRVPVGYWIAGIDNTSTSDEMHLFAPGGLIYLDALVKDWANKYDIAVLIDIHAAKGSQNGKDHGSPTVKDLSFWFDYNENVDNTVDVVAFLAHRYKKDPSFLGINLLNEPGGRQEHNEVLSKYYKRAYKVVRDDGNDCILITSPLIYEQNTPHLMGLMRYPEYTNVWHEWHKYLVFDKFGEMTEDQLLTDGIEFYKKELDAWRGNSLFIGEWCVATGGNAPFKDEKKFKQFTEKSVELFNNAKGGWTFWSWKISGDEQGRNGWSLRSLIRRKLIKF